MCGAAVQLNPASKADCALILQGMGEIGVPRLQPRPGLQLPSAFINALDDLFSPAAWDEEGREVTVQRLLAALG